MKPEFRLKLNKLLAEERKQPLGWWYLSYADDENWRGGIYIEAHGFTEACYLAAHRHLSPGGEVLGIPVSLRNLPIPAPEYRNRLLNKEQMRAANPNEDCMTLSEFKAEKKGE